MFQSCIDGKNIGLSYHCNSYTLLTANPGLELISFVLHVLDPLLKSQGNRKSTVYVVLKDNGGGECKSLRIMSSFQAHKQLSPHSRLGSNNELDCYLDAIVRSSMGVANSCEGVRREKIIHACQSVSTDKWLCELILEIYIQLYVK